MYILRLVAAVVFFFILVVGNTVQAKLPVLRMALLPVPDVLPVYVALEEGFFAREGVRVEVLPVGSAVARDQLMQAGRIDGMINELSGAASLNREKIMAKVVSFARIPSGECPLFRVLAAPGSNFDKPSDLADVPIGVSKNTVIEYVTGRLLAREGLAVEKIVYASVPVLPERLQLLLSGQIRAATLPEPLGSSAIEAGAVEIASDLRLQDLSASVITFSQEVVEKNRKAVAAFVRAWNMAAAEINAAPARWKKVFLAKIRVPQNIQQSYQIPPFPLYGVPTKAQWNDAMAWMIEKGQLKEALPYENTITDEFSVEAKNRLHD